MSINGKKIKEDLQFIVKLIKIINEFAVSKYKMVNLLFGMLLQKQLQLHGQAVFNKIYFLGGTKHVSKSSN